MEPSQRGIAPVSSIRWSRINLTMLVLWIVTMIDKTNLGVLIANKQFLNDFGLAMKPVSIGLLLSSVMYGYLLGSIGWGFVVDRLGARRVLLWVVAAWSV